MGCKKSKNEPEKIPATTGAAYYPPAPKLTRCNAEEIPVDRLNRYLVQRMDDSWQRWKERFAKMSSNHHTYPRLELALACEGKYHQTIHDT